MGYCLNTDAGSTRLYGPVSAYDFYELRWAFFPWIVRTTKHLKQ